MQQSAPISEGSIGALEPVPVQRLAQGITCGQWALAFPFDWARQIVESFELSAIPKAPPWLMGAANIDGNIVPVVDLAIYFGSAVAGVSPVLQQRLLVGGIVGTEVDEAMALAFSGLPQQLKYQPEQLTYAGALPETLREVCRWVAKDSGGHDFLEIDISALRAILADELSLM